MVRARSQGSCVRGSAITSNASYSHSLTFLELIWSECWALGFKNCLFTIKKVA